ncbi:MAG: DUF2975 domain-containing protein [Acidimicrobiia bacterium]
MDPPPGAAQPTPRAVTIAANLTTILLAIAALVSVLIIGSAIAGGIGGERDIGVLQEVAPERLSSLPDDVLLPERVPVTVRVEDVSMGASLLDMARSLGPIALVVAFLWLVRGLLQSVRAGDPFVAVNVRRLRIIGFLLAVGVPAVQLLTQLVDGALTSGSAVGELGGSFTLSGNAPLAGLGVFVLAEVFAHGVRLREDVEGTI